VSVETTDLAKEVLRRSVAAARRFNPEATIRLVRRGSAVEPVLAERAEPGDERLDLEGVVVESGIGGLLDVEPPHDRLVLKPPGSAPNPRE